MATTEELYNLYKKRFINSANSTEKSVTAAVGKTNQGVRDYMRSAIQQAGDRVRQTVTDAIPTFANAAYQRHLSEKSAQESGTYAPPASGFSYNPDEDATYKAFQKQADREASDAYKQYLAKVSARTGGRASTYAAQVAAQAAIDAANGANNALANLYNTAYNKYMNQYKDAEYPMDYNVPDAGNVVGQTGGTQSGQSSSSSLPSSNMQGGDVPGYNRPAESAYIPQETVTADPREQHRPATQPSAFGDTSGGSRAYTVENGKKYYVNGQGQKLVDENLNPIEVQYDENGDVVPNEDIENAYDLSGGVNEQIVEAGKELGLEAVDIGDERYTNDTSAGELGYFNAAGGTYYCDGKGYPLLNENGVFVSVVRDENGRIIPYTELVVRAEIEADAAEEEADQQEEEEYDEYADGMPDPTGEIAEEEKKYRAMSDEEMMSNFERVTGRMDEIVQEIEAIVDQAEGMDETSAEYASLSDKYYALIDELKKLDNERATIDGIATQKQAEERIGILTENFPDGKVTNTEDWDTIQKNFTPGEIAKAGLTYAENAGSGYTKGEKEAISYDEEGNLYYDDTFPGLTAQEKENIDVNVAEEYDGMTALDIIDSDKYQNLYHKLMDGTITESELYEMLSIEQMFEAVSSGNMKEEKRRRAEGVEEIEYEDILDIFNDYPNGVVTNKAVWDFYVDTFGQRQLASMGIRYKN